MKNMKNINLVLALVMVAVATATAACGGDDDKDDADGAGGGGGNVTAMVKGSCQNEMNGICHEYWGSSYTAATVEPMCASLADSEFVAGACATAGLLGTCVIGKDEAAEKRYRYYAPFSAMAAQSQCTALKGEWTGS